MSVYSTIDESFEKTRDNIGFTTTQFSKKEM